MLCNYKAWEAQLFSMSKPIEFLVSKKSLTGHSRCVLQTLGTFGILLTFFGFYGCKNSIKALTFTTLFIIMLTSLSLNTQEPKDLTAEVINMLKLFSLAGGLLEAW
jgi:hypothetical protein